jgi:hypothetical protein
MAVASLKERLPVYGQWTYRGAWTLEIAAAGIGIVTGIALGMQAFANSAPGSVTLIELALASSPFLMVAIAELTKIPIATLLFSAKWIWKPVILVILLLLAGITFETVFMGLERAATLRQLHYEEITRQIDGQKFERDQLAGRVAAADGNNLLGSAQADLDRISQQADTERQKIVAQIDEATRELSGAGVITPEAVRLKEKIAGLEAERQKIAAERDDRVAKAVAQFESQRDSFVKRIEIAAQAGDRELQRRTERQLANLKNPRLAIEQEYAPKIDGIDGQIGEVRSELDQEIAAKGRIGESQRAAIDKRIEGLRRQLAEFDAEIAKRKADAQQQIADAQSRQRARADTTEAATQRSQEIETELSALEKQRIQNARTDQIRRIASRVYGVKPEQVNEEQAGLVSVIWFGSLAALAALAGPITAIVALALQRVSEPKEMPQPSRLSHLIRRWLLSWRWRRVRSVPVKVEVPVEKIVEKRVEVPVEKLVKEILYVPVLTNDPEAIRQKIEETAPADLANVVSVAMAKRH